MSRIGNLPVSVPAETTVGIEAGRITVKGPKGTLEVPVPAGVEAVVEGKTIVIRAEPGLGAMQGLTRALANNCVTGVTKGFERKLEIVGVGYRARLIGGAKLAGRVLELQLGYSHPIEVLLPEGVAAKVEANTRITLTGIDKQVVGQTAANIRALRKPDVYKNKGVRYAGEVLRQKAGKRNVA